MSNMSYCRMENTNSDLSDCVDAIENKGFHSLSDDEKTEAKNLYEKCKDFIAAMENDYDFEKLLDN